MLEPLIEPLAHDRQRVGDLVRLLVELSDLVEDSIGLVCLLIHVVVIDVVLVVILLVEGVHVDFSCTIGREVDVVNTVLELASHLVSVLMKRLLDDILVALSDLAPELQPHALIHDLLECTPSHGKSIDHIDLMVQKLRALVI